MRYTIVQAVIFMFFHFVIIRGDCHYYVTDSIRRKKINELKTGQTLYEWLFYRRFRAIIPNFMLIEYYIAFVWDLCAIIIMFIINIVPVDENFASTFYGIYNLITLIWLFIHYFTFHRVSWGIHKGESFWRNWIDPNPKRKKK